MGPPWVEELPKPIFSVYVRVHNENLEKLGYVRVHNENLEKVGYVRVHNENLEKRRLW